MHKFAFIVHPPDIDTIRKYYFKPGSRSKSNSLIEKFLEWLPPFKSTHITGIRSKETGKMIEGNLIVCPLLPRQFKENDQCTILDKVVEACQLAIKLDARIVGLGAFTSIVGNQGIEIAKQVSIPVTTGNSYTVALITKAIEKLCSTKRVLIEDSTITVIGATGSIGNACARLFSAHAKNLVLVGRSKEKLEVLAQSLDSHCSASIQTTINVKEAVSSADIVVTTTSATEKILTASDFRKDAIVCDVAIPKNIIVDNDSQNHRYIFEGGIAKPYGHIQYSPPIPFLRGTTFGCMAETMILALEGRFECFSLGSNLALEKITEIWELGVKHGFDIVIQKSGGI